MKDNINDGIVFDSTVYLSEENRRKFPVYMRFLQVLAISIGGHSFISIFLQSFELQIINKAFLMTIILLTIVSYFMIVFSAYDLIKLISTFAIYGAIIYYWRKSLENGFYHLENAIIEVASDYYNFPAYRYIADYSTRERDLTRLIIIIIIPVLVILTISILRGKLRHLCYGLMLVPIVISFTMGVTPPELNMVAYILVLLFVFISNGFSGSEASLRSKFGKVHKSMLYRISIRVATIFCVLALLLFFILKLFIPIEKYEAYDGITEAKSNIQKFMMDFSMDKVSKKFSDIQLNIGTKKLVATGGLSMGKLGKTDSVDFNETEHLQISAPIKSVLEGIYLKGYVGSVYTGDSWDTHTRQIIENYDSLVERTWQYKIPAAIGSGRLLADLPYNAFVEQGRIEITYKNANRKHVYAPSFSRFNNSDNIEFDYDLAVTSNELLDDITIEYSYDLSHLIESELIMGLLSGEDWIIEGYGLQEYVKFEKEYRAFVYDTYTRLPEKGLDKLKYDFSRDQVGSASESLQDAIAYIKDYLDNNTKYSLSPGRLPKDKDFVEYFLYENKIGYCAHYASAGALMLRAMGYPARYVEGYAVNSSDLPGGEVMVSKVDHPVSITVKDSNAHAWVEVYFDGFGWFPIEFTSSSGMEDLAGSVENLGRMVQNRREKEKVPTPTPTPAPTLTPSPVPTDKPVKEIKPTQPVGPKDDGGPQDKTNITQVGNKTYEGFKWYLLTIPALIILIGLLLYVLYIRRKRKEAGDPNHSKNALKLYRRIECLFILSRGLPKKDSKLEDNEDYIKENYALHNIGEFEICMDIVRKARFGREIISQKEYQIVEEFYNSLFNQAYKRIPFFKRMFFRVYSIYL
mgnify:CR=1 FL=1